MAFKTALIVDDSKLARVTLKKKLEMHGLQVSVADSAEQAFECLSTLNPDIVFMDHLMPGTDGFEATQHIRKMAGFELTPIVMCTGKEHDGYLEEALAIGANFILSKPPADEALDAILFGNPAEVTEDVEVARIEPPAVIDEQNPVLELPIPEVVADIISENDMPSDELVEDAVLDTLEIPDAAVLTEDTIPQLPVMNEQVTENMPATPEVAAAISIDEIRQICTDLIQAERVGIIVDVLANIPPPELPEIPAPVVNMDSILSTVNASVAHQLAVNASSIKSELKQEIDGAVARMLDQDIQGILDLRVNVILTEKFAQTSEKIEALQQQIHAKAQTPDFALPEMSLKLQQPTGVDARIEQLFEEQMQLKSKLKLFQVIAAAAVLLGAAALALVLK